MFKYNLETTWIFMKDKYKVGSTNRLTYKVRRAYPTLYPSSILFLPLAV